MPQRDKKTGQFLVGHNGKGGRPKGARTKLGEKFIKDLLAAWEKGGQTVMAEAMAKDPAGFLRVIAGILPKELAAEITHKYVIHAPTPAIDMEEWHELRKQMIQ